MDSGKRIYTSGRHVTSGTTEESPTFEDGYYSFESKSQLKAFNSSSETASSNSTEAFKRPSERRRTRIILPSGYLMIGIVLLVLISAIFIETTLLIARQFDQNTVDSKPTVTVAEPSPKIEELLPSPRSCLDLKKAGVTSSGVKKIFNSGSVEYEVYCDMETDEGGWTLVASVHEDDIQSKCDSNDRWSTFATAETCNRGSTAWEDKVTFGSLHECTSDDYKISAYHSFDAKDVMIWHVPEGVPLDTMKNNSHLRYRTTNNFLSDNGGNLQALFHDYYELNIRGNYKSLSESKQKFATIRTSYALETQSQNIKSHIRDWFDYSEWGGTMLDDYMYNGYLYEDEGNWVVFNTSLQTTTLVYDREYWLGVESNFSIIARKTHPFIMVGAIRNDAKEFSYFETTIKSNHYTETERRFFINNDIEMGNYKLLYRSVYFPMAYYDTVCEFHFIVYNEKDWFSDKPTSFELDVQVMYQVRRKFGFKVDGSPTNFVMGYILLASKNSTDFNQEALDNVARTILSTYAKIPTLFDDFGGSDGLSVPVTFDKGDENTVLQMIPDNIHKYVEPGFLQLRAYNKDGFPSAMCPGARLVYLFPLNQTVLNDFSAHYHYLLFRTRSHYAEYICFGGASDDVSVNGTCGDFAIWDGKAEKNVTGNDDASDRDSTILIFYR